MRYGIPVAYIKINVTSRNPNMVIITIDTTITIYKIQQIGDVMYWPGVTLLVPGTSVREPIRLHHSCKYLTLVHVAGRQADIKGSTIFQWDNTQLTRLFVPKLFRAARPFRITTTICQFVLMITDFYENHLQNHLLQIQYCIIINSTESPAIHQNTSWKHEDWWNTRSNCLSRLYWDLPPSRPLQFIFCWRFLENKWRSNWYNSN